MIPCLVVCQVLVFLVLGRQTEVYNGSLQNDDKNGIERENQAYVGIKPPSMLAFVPARSCHIQFSKDSGTFSPPVFFGQIDVNLWCNWTIVAAQGKHIVIYIDGFHTNINCNEYHDEIIFEKISSSVETTIVSACWNKPTHVFAAQALAVNVVLLWRTFSQTGSSKYFEGRYYIFDDLPASLNGHPCYCSLTPSTSMTETDVTTVTKGPQIDVSAVYYFLSITLSTSKLPIISTKGSEVHHDEEHEFAYATPQPPLHVAKFFTAGTFATDLLKDVLSPVVQIPSSTTEVVQLSSSHSSIMDEKKHIDIQTAGDLQPSFVGQWEPSDWIWEKTLSLSETPELSTVHTEVLVTPYFSGTHNLELYVTPQFSTTYLTDLPMTIHYGTAHVVKLHKITPTREPYIAMLQETEPVTQEFSKNIHIPMATHLSDALFSELTKVNNFSEEQFIMGSVTPPVSAIHQTEVPQNYVETIVNKPKLNNAFHYKIYNRTRAPKTTLDFLYMKSHLEKPTSVPPLSWQKPSLPAVTATAESMKPVFTAERNATKSSTTPWPFAPVQFTSLLVEQKPASQWVSFGLKPQAFLPTTKSSSEDNGDKNGIQVNESENQDRVGFISTSMRAFVPAKSCHVQLSKDSGTFSPPVILGQIDVNLWCNWTILASPEKHILIYIDGFHTNTNCDENQDEIIFESILSSVETTIVYACWNKPTYAYATRALAVNIVLLWRTFSHTGSSKYFEGRYYIFDDPAPGLNAHPCNCSLEPSKFMAETAVNTVPKELPIDVSPVYSFLPPTLSTSKLPNISTKGSEIHHDREHELGSAAPQPPLHVAHYLTTGTPAVDMLKNVLSPVLPIPSSSSEVVHPSPSHSSVMNEDKYTDMQTTGDLQPSFVGQWKPASPLDWIWEKTLSLFETPELSTARTEVPATPKGAHDLEFPFQVPMATHFSAVLISEFTEMHNVSKEQFMMAPVTPSVRASPQTKVPQNYVTSIFNRTKLPTTLHFNTDHSSRAPKTILDLLYIESHVEKPSSVLAPSWQKPALPSVTPTDKISPSHWSSFTPKHQVSLPTTKSLSKDLDNQTVNESPVLQLVLINTMHTDYSLHLARPTSAVLGFQINTFGGIYSTNIAANKETVSGPSPQNEVLVRQRGVPKDATSSPPPQFPDKPSLSKSSLQITVMEKEMDIKSKNVLNVTKDETLPTEAIKSKELFTKDMGWIGHWLVNHSLHDSGLGNQWTTQPVTSTSPDVADVRGTKMTTSNASHENDYFDLNQEEIEQPRSDVFDISRNHTELQFPHDPEDSLFKITAEIEHQHIKLREWERELVEVVKAKIIEKMTYIPSGVNSLNLKDVTLTNSTKLTLTFWLHLQPGGKKLGNFIRTQVKTLGGQLIGTVGATLVSLSVEDVNECQLGIQNCDVQAQCANEFGSYSCQCMKGYEDHSPDAPGTVCIASQPAEIYSLSGHMEVLVASLGGVAITLLLAILLLCIVHLRRHNKANFNLHAGAQGNQHADSIGALPASQAECGQMMPSLARHMSPRQKKEKHTARDTSSTLELTNITFEQTAC